MSAAETITAALHVALPPRPYPGLRPFLQSEWQIFFGREAMTDDIIERLGNQCLVLVHGSSGSGKSSLIRAGVLPRLVRQQQRRGVAWTTATIRPSGGPLWNLAVALAEAGGLETQPEIDRLRLSFDNPGATLAGIVAGLPLLGGRSLCLLVDQFEEVFQYARDGFVDEAHRFTELLTSLLDEPMEAPVRAILTMRSEYLGECARLPGLARVANANLYLVPPMEPDDLRRAIRRPAELFGGVVSPELADRLIKDVEGDQDELPLIQHGLMRLWSQAAPPEGAAELDLPLYDLPEYAGANPLQRLLNDHADEVLARAAPTEPDLRTAEEIFRALTDTNADGQSIRRPQRLSALAAVADVPLEMVERIVAPFREDGTSFVTPPQPRPLTAQTVLDLGHEALIRCWDRMSQPVQGWQSREVRDGLIWRALLQAAEGGSELSEAVAAERLRWMRRRTETWARRYGGGWREVRALIRESLLRGRTRLRERRRELAALASAEARAATAEAKRKEAEVRAENQKLALTVGEAKRKEADARAKYFRRTSLLSISLIVLGFTAAILFYYNAQSSISRELLRMEIVAQQQRALTQQQATEFRTRLDAERLEVANERADGALSAQIWSDLDIESSIRFTPRVRNALWELARSSERVKRAFVARLTADRSAPQRFARGFEPISRALGLAWPSPAEHGALVAALAASLSQALTRVPPDWEAVSGAMQALVRLDRMPSDLVTQTAVALDGSRRSFPNRNATRQIMEMARVLAPLLTTPGETDALAELIHETLRFGDLDPEASLAAGEALLSLAPRLGIPIASGLMRLWRDRLQISGSQAPVLASDGIPEMGAEAEQFDAILSALARRLETGSNNQAERNPASDLRTLAASVAESGTVRQIAALAPWMDPPAMERAARGIVKRLLADDAARGSAAEAIARLAPGLGSPTAAAAIEALRRPPRGGVTNTPFSTEISDAVWQALVLRLDGATISALAEAVLAETPSDTNGDVQLLTALVPHLSVDMLAQTVEALLRIPLSGEWRQPGAELATVLAPRLPPDLAERVAAKLFNDLELNTNPISARRLSQAVAAVLPRVASAARSGLATQTLEAVEAAPDKGRDNRLRLLGLLAPYLAPAEAARGAMLFRSRWVGDPLETALMVPLIRLAPSSSDAAAILNVMLWDNRVVGAQVDSLFSPLEAVGPLLEPDEAAELARLFIPMLAWTEESQVSVIVAHIVAASQALRPVPDAIATFVETLKFPTAASRPTEILLDAIRGRDPAAPGAAAGLAANLVWLRTAYPAIDLLAPPSCPSPPTLEPGLACPGTGPLPTALPPAPVGPPTMPP